MATNPRIPENRERPRPLNVIQGRKRPGRVWNGVVTALAVIVVLLGLVIYFLPRAPKAAQPASTAEIAASGAALQLQDLQMSMDPTGRSLILQGRISNHGTLPVNGAVMHVQFVDAQGASAGSVDEPIELVQTSGRGINAAAMGTMSLFDAPLKPNEARPFRVETDQVPANWNHEMPKLSFVQVTSHP